jgi:hypothetical protein
LLHKEDVLFSEIKRRKLQDKSVLEVLSVCELLLSVKKVSYHQEAFYLLEAKSSESLDSMKGVQEFYIKHLNGFLPPVDCDILYQHDLPPFRKLISDRYLKMQQTSPLKSTYLALYARRELDGWAEETVKFFEARPTEGEAIARVVANLPLEMRDQEYVLLNQVFSKLLLDMQQEPEAGPQTPSIAVHTITSFYVDRLRIIPKDIRYMSYRNDAERRERGQAVAKWVLENGEGALDLQREQIDSVIRGLRTEAVDESILAGKHLQRLLQTDLCVLSVASNRSPERVRIHAFKRIRAWWKENREKDMLGIHEEAKRFTKDLEAFLESDIIRVTDEEKAALAQAEKSKVAVRRQGRVLARILKGVDAESTPKHLKVTKYNTAYLHCLEMAARTKDPALRTFLNSKKEEFGKHIAAFGARTPTAKDLLGVEEEEAEPADDVQKDALDQEAQLARLESMNAKLREMNAGSKVTLNGVPVAAESTQTPTEKKEPVTKKAVEEKADQGVKPPAVAPVASPRSVSKPSRVVEGSSRAYWVGITAGVVGILLIVFTILKRRGTA